MFHDHLKRYVALTCSGNYVAKADTREELIDLCEPIIAGDSQSLQIYKRVCTLNPTVLVVEEGR